MKKISWISILIIVCSITISASDLDFSGYVRNYSGILVTEDINFVIMQNSFDLSMKYNSSRGGMVVNPYLNLKELEIGTLDFREIYMDLYFDDLDLRIGRQQVIWGKADGVFITDVVSPKNLEEFILPDFREIRLGVNAAKLDYYIGSSTLEIIWVPLFTPNKMPGVDSIWNIKNIDFSGSNSDIKMNLENSELFGRYSLMTPIFDFELVGGSMWDDEPVIKSKALAGIEFEFKRLIMAGGSISSTLGDFILRGEGAYYIGKGFNGNTGSLFESDYIHYMFGTDYSFLGYKMSVQFIQRIILDHEELMINKEYENTITLMINKSFLGETLTTEFFSYLELDDLNALLKPKITYDFDDNIDIVLGANIFVGDSGTYGQFDNNDTVYTQIKFNF